MDTCGHVGWQINSTKNHKHKPQRAKRRSPSQICASPSSRETKQKANGAGPNKNNHNQDLPWTQWWKATVSQLTKRCTNELVATQKSETRFLIVVADTKQKKALAVYYCILKWLHAAKSSIILVGLLHNRSLKVLPQAVWVCGCAHKFFWHAQIEKRVSLNASVFYDYDWSFGGLTVFIFREIK